MILAVAFALAAAFSSAVNLITQHAASISAPKREKGWRLALYLLRQPLWLLGWAAAAGTFIFQAFALHNGPMSVVQPVLITELVFVLALRWVWFHQRVAAAAWASVVVVCLALAVFLIAAEPTGGQTTPETKQWLSAVLVFGGAIAVLTALGRTGPPVRRAAVFAVAAGLTWAMEATFLKALRSVEAVSPAVLWIDEIEMGVGGYREGGDASMSRIFSGFLTWMQEKSALVFVAATANRIQLLPAEVIRKGRFDQVFFVDLPNEEERKQIFGIHLKKNRCDPGRFDLVFLAKATKGWNGAEIEQIVVSSVVDSYSEKRTLTEDDLHKVISTTVPLSITMEDQIKAIKSWAHDRALNASRP